MSLGALSGLAAALLSPYTVRIVDGPSMSPSLNPATTYKNPTGVTSDVVLVRLKPRGLTPEEAADLVGSVVTLRDPRNADSAWSELTKRLAAGPGQKVVPLSPGSAKAKAPVVVPRDQCWVESDAGYGYKDSNLFGPVPLSSVTGLVRMVVWPPLRMGFDPNSVVVGSGGGNTKRQ